MNPELQRLATELANDPEQRGYANMTPAQVVADLNDPRYVEHLTTISTSAIYNAIVPSDFVALSEDNKQRVRDILSLGSVDVRDGTNARSVMISIFSGTPTLSALAALTQTTTSRAQQIGYQSVTEQMVMRVREAQ